jgi:hypothetical protein
VLFLRQQATLRTNLVVAVPVVLIACLGLGQLRSMPSVPNWIRFDGRSYDSTFISPYEPVACQPSSWLRARWKVWPLGAFAGHVSGVEGSLDSGGFTAGLERSGSGLPVYRSTNDEGLPVLVERTGPDCYVVFVRDP